MVVCSRRVAIAAAILLSVSPTVRPLLAAQDTSAIDRGVRIGIVYRPGVRPGLVLLPGRDRALDSLRTIILRDLDYSDRFEIITLPGGEEVSLSGTLEPRSAGRAGGAGGAGGAASSSRAGAAGGVSRGTHATEIGLNYQLYRALGADFALEVGRRADTTLLVVHDVGAAAPRRTLRTVLPSSADLESRIAVHRLADQVMQVTLGAPGIAATRMLFVLGGKVYRIDQDGANMKMVSSTGRQAMSPAWGADGRRFAYMEFAEGKGQLFVHDLSTGKRSPAATTGRSLDFTPAFSPDQRTLAFSRANEEGTDIYTINVNDNCCLQRLTVGRFSDNLSPTYSPDGQRIAFVSTRSGLPQIYVMAADGTDQQLFAPYDYGVTGSSNAPEWSPDGQSVAFHRDVAGTLQVFVLDVRSRTVRQLTSVGRNEDPSWAPDSRHLAFVSDRAGYRQLWIIDLETGRIRPLLQQSGARLPAWSPRLPEIGSSSP
jgi:TolB protein